ncbi:hypothetical protein LTR56_019382 [Elasticomyces elasticus]|nr:hypothetical protein LTR56_019382 [Elasticomyces elasticus]KAK3658624.1 hypothetical protein LTR22_008796 [Elasticomyces elasticus]KAK4911396.1 hypothetical protein LTR49_020047 [Elasticomyces elasticus]KAK5756561.1 hypothetical protein LTS12_013277 [Elasticomyces elasticus]
MGIHGLLKELGPPPRQSLATLSATHYTTHSRPLVLAIDISIWLFQIQSGKGGSNPALRTFYYRLLRLLSLNINPLFVFDGPNKPLFKRNKKVGGPGVKVASVPEFLAKQLLKEFGFPWHVAPGEAEAECALLQREGIADAVLSEDVDTLMFGSGVTYRDWRAEGANRGSKAPTHVSVYREKETKERSRGVAKEGMILVALMSGGDYLPEGIPGCGPKVACDAARVGFGAELCALGRNDTAGLKEWKQRLEQEIRTNTSKFFSRKNPSFNMPEDFPNKEVLGYYTHPCVSNADKLARLRAALKWDQPIDFPALRTFAADAFDWRCVGGAKKFIKNLAPALLVREMRRRGDCVDDGDDIEAREAEEKQVIGNIHGKRNHATVDEEMELRVSFVPANFVPIDLSLEDEDDEFIPAGGIVEADSEAESEFALLPPSSAVQEEDEEDDAEPAKKKRVMKPFDPDQPEKIWVLRTWVQVGCPILVEEYDASFRDPKAFFKQRRAAKGGSESTNIHAKKKAPAKASSKSKKKGVESSSQVPVENALTRYATQVTKAGVEREPLKQQSSSQENAQRSKGSAADQRKEQVNGDSSISSGFRLASTQIPASVLEQLARDEEREERRQSEYDVVDLSADTPKAIPDVSAGQRGGKGNTGVTVSAKPASSDDLSGIVDLSATARPRPFAAFARSIALPPSSAPIATTKATVKAKPKTKVKPTVPDTPPRRKRRSQEVSSPGPPPSSQRTITNYWSPSPRKPLNGPVFVDLVSSSPAKLTSRARSLTPAPPNLRKVFVRSPEPTLPAPSFRLADEDDDLPPAFSPGKLPDTVTKRRRKGPLRRWQTAPVSGGNDEAPELGLEQEKGCTHEDAGHTLEAIDLALSPITTRVSGGGGFLVDDEDHESEEELPSPSSFITGINRLRAEKGSMPPLPKPVIARKSVEQHKQSPSYPTPPPTANLDTLSMIPAAAATKPRSKVKPSKPVPTVTRPTPVQRISPRQSTSRPSMAAPTRRSPRQAQKVQKKKAFLLRQSLEGAWKEVDAETIDMSGDGSGWKMSGGKAAIVGSSSITTGSKAFRKSGVEVLDMTGA